MSTLDPFAMYTAFPCSDYYGSSAPLRRHQPATGLPHPAGRDQRKWFPRSLSNPSTGSVPSYAPATSPRLRRSPSPWPPCWRHLPAQEFPDRPDPSGVRCNPALICQVGAGGLCLRGFPPLVPRVHRRWFLAYTFPSRLPDPRHLTVLARPVVVRAASTLADVPRVGLPSASVSLLRQADGGGLSPPQGSRTPRGARYPRTTRDWAAGWPIP